MQKITAIIVDDEKEARDGLLSLLTKDQDIELLGACADGMDALEKIQALKPALLFLDIQMPEINGFEVLNSLPSHLLPSVIFTTAYDQYALQAFQVHALDYLLKPFSDDRFYEALNVAKVQIRSKLANEEQHRLLSLLQGYENQVKADVSRVIHEAPGNVATLQRLAVKANGKIHLLPTKQIIFLEACDYYVRICTREQNYMVRESLRDLHERLCNQEFCRIHRAHVINLRAVKEVIPYNNGDFFVLLRNNQKLRGSRSYRQALFDLISNTNAKNT